MCKEWAGGREIGMSQVEDFTHDDMQKMQDSFEGESEEQRRHHLSVKVLNIWVLSASPAFYFTWYHLYYMYNVQIF